MPLILAIEPDNRQAALVSDLAHGLGDGAELVLMTSAEEAIRTIDAKVPDLILTSTLLSPSDENMLTDRLRKLDSAGAHVQTLVIPLLAEPQLEPEPQGGLLSRFGWKKKKASAPDGCDPAVFGGQIKEYLNRAHVLRRAFTHLPPSPLGYEDERHPVEEPAREEPPVVASTGPVLLPESDLVRDPDSPLTGLFRTEDPAEPATVIEPPAQDAPAAAPVEPLFSLEEALVGFEQPPVAQVSEPQWAEPLVSDIDALSAELDAVLAAHAADVAPQPEVAFQPEAAFQAAVVLEPAADPAPVEPAPVEPAALHEPAAAADVAEVSFRKDLLELLAAIQLDLEPLRSAPEIRSSVRAKPAERLQDEWGFFDPQQCGMAALLARLDEMARQREAAPGRG